MKCPTKKLGYRSQVAAIGAGAFHSGGVPRVFECKTCGKWHRGNVAKARPAAKGATA